MRTYMIQFPALELSLAGLNFYSQVFVSHRYRLQFSSVLYYAVFFLFLYVTTCTFKILYVVFFWRKCVKSSNVVKGIVLFPSSVTKCSCSIKFLDDWTSSMWIAFTIIFTHRNSSISLINVAIPIIFVFGKSSCLRFHCWIICWFNFFLVTLY